jgi:hypothetical protein
LIGRDSWLLFLRLALPVRPEQIFVLFVATGEGAVMCVMERLANASCEMGVSRGDDYPDWSFGLVLDLDNSSQRMFGFDSGLFISGEPDNLVPMRGDKLTGKQQHPAGCAVPYPFTGRAPELMTLRWGRNPCPPAFVVDRFAFTTHRRLQKFALRFVWIVHPGSNRSIFLVSGNM